MKIVADGGLPSHDARRWQSEPHLRHSLAALRAILDRLERDDMRMYRMATALAPYASHPELPQFHGQVRECPAELAALLRLRAQLTERGLPTRAGRVIVSDAPRPACGAAAAA